MQTLKTLVKVFKKVMFLVGWRVRASVSLLFHNEPSQNTQSLRASKIVQQVRVPDAKLTT